MLFLRKTDETIWNPLSKRTLRLSTNPPISEQFVHDRPLCPNFKTEIPTHPNMEKTMVHDRDVYSQIKQIKNTWR